MVTSGDLVSLASFPMPIDGFETGCRLLYPDETLGPFDFALSGPATSGGLAGLERDLKARSESDHSPDM